MDNDGYISNGELFQVLKMMVGNNLKDTQLQQIVDKTIVYADKDEDGKISFEEFCNVCIVSCTSSILMYMKHGIHSSVRLFLCRWQEIRIFTRRWWSMFKKCCVLNAQKMNAHYGDILIHEDAKKDCEADIFISGD